MTSIIDTVAYYKYNIDKYWDDENYKWIAVKNFQINWDPKAEDFTAMLEKSLAKSENLLQGGNYYPRRMILELSRKDPEKMRSLFVLLGDETRSLAERIKTFRAGCDELLSAYQKDSPDHGKVKKHYQDLRAVCVYLSFMYPDKWFLYKWQMYNDYKKLTEYEETSTESDSEIRKYDNYARMCQDVLDVIKEDEELLQEQSERVAKNPDCYSDPELHLLAQTVIYVSKDMVKKETEISAYWPSEEEYPYPVNITKDQWAKYIEEVEYPYHMGCMRMLKALMELGGEASCKKLSDSYGGSPSAYVGFAVNIGKRAKKYFSLPPCMDGDIERYFPIPFLGRPAIEDGIEYFTYKMRKALYEALGDMDLSDINPKYQDKDSKQEGECMHEIVPAAKGGFNKIYYGAPGCGKSYYVKKMLIDADVADEEIFRVTFHPEYTNTDFIGQILPTVEERVDEMTGETKEIVRYQFNPGPFTLALQRAFSTPNMVYLVIEEINRGNAAAIFGDLFQLLDRVKDITESGFSASEYPIRNVPVQDYLIGSKVPYCTVEREAIRKGLFIPGNLTILATMNSSDQNVFTLDTAFKRRWSFEQISNDISRDDSHKYKNWYIPGTDVTWERFLVAINNQILDYKLHNHTNEDKRLGKYFVTRDCLTETVETIDDAKETAENFAYKVLEYVWNDVCKIGREEWFDTEKNRTLEDLIDSFINPKEDGSPLDVFQNMEF